jgi:hypothetical protein
MLIPVLPGWRSMRAAIAFVLLMLLAAGCLGAKPAPAGNETPSATDAKGNLTGPVDNGQSKAAIADTGSVAHMHDYWQGKERVTLFDGDLTPDPENATFATVFRALTQQGVYAGGMLWNLPDGKLVFEGTGRMELTATWTDPRNTDIGFEYRSAEGGDFKAGGQFANGKAFLLPITPTMTDMPHSKSSRWAFGFGPTQSPGATMGPFHLKIDIIKLNAIELFPPHPDFWHGNHTLSLLDTDHHGQVDSYAVRTANLATKGDFVEDMVSLKHPVPMEAQAIRFDLKITSASSTPGSVSSFGFFYHGADTANPFRCPVKPLNGTLPAMLSWTVPVTMDETDSPYANDSQWQFLVEPQAQLAPGSPEVGGMTEVSYDYHVVATAMDMKPDQVDKCAQDNPGN